MTMNPISIPTIVLVAILAIAPCAITFTSPIPPPHAPAAPRPRRSATSLASSVASGAGASAGAGAGARDAAPATPITPTTFREGEVLGLRLMQAGKHEEAVTTFKKAMTLPGSRFDILRESNVPGASPVGGSKGGTASRAVRTLDEFEFQAAHYNMACAHAALGDAGEAVGNLRKAFDYGFDNVAAVRGDPDLASVRGTEDFERLLEEVAPKFNPFGLFGK